MPDRHDPAQSQSLTLRRFSGPIRLSWGQPMLDERIVLNATVDSLIAMDRWTPADFRRVSPTAK
jgi:hypothetical protein